MSASVDIIYARRLKEKIGKLPPAMAFSGAVPACTTRKSTLIYLKYSTTTESVKRFLIFFFCMQKNGSTEPFFSTRRVLVFFLYFFNSPFHSYLGHVRVVFWVLVHRQQLLQW